MIVHSPVAVIKGDNTYTADKAIRSCVEFASRVAFGILRPRFLHYFRLPVVGLEASRVLFRERRQTVYLACTVVQRIHAILPVQRINKVRSFDAAFSPIPTAPTERPIH